MIWFDFFVCSANQLLMDLIQLWLCVSYICQMDWSSWMVVCLAIFRVQCSISNFVFCKYYHSISTQFSHIFDSDFAFAYCVLGLWFSKWFWLWIKFNLVGILQIRNCMVQPRLTSIWAKTPIVNNKRYPIRCKKMKFTKLRKNWIERKNIFRTLFGFLLIGIERRIRYSVNVNICPSNNNQYGLDSDSWIFALLPFSFHSGDVWNQCQKSSF